MECNPFVGTIGFLAVPHRGYGARGFAKRCIRKFSKMIVQFREHHLLFTFSSIYCLAKRVLVLEQEQLDGKC